MRERKREQFGSLSAPNASIREPEPIDRGAGVVANQRVDSGEPLDSQREPVASPDSELVWAPVSEGRFSA